MRKTLLVSLSVFLLLAPLVCSTMVHVVNAADAYVYVKVWKDCRSCGYAQKSGWKSGPAPISVSRSVGCGWWIYRHTYAYCKVGVTCFFCWWKHGYVFPTLYVLWPGRYAKCSWYWEDPPEAGSITNVSLALSNGLVLNQTGSSSAYYEVTLEDLTAGEILYNAMINVSYGYFDSTPNWIEYWEYESPTNGSALAELSPCNITVDIPEGHSFRETHNSSVWCYEEGGNASIVSVLKEKPVGGVWVPADKFALLAPYITLASTIIAATAATAIYVKRVKREKSGNEDHITFIFHSPFFESSKNEITSTSTR